MSSVHFEDDSALGRSNSRSTRPKSNPYNTTPYTYTQRKRIQTDEKVDKATIEWRDFVGSLKRRKRLINLIHSSCAQDAADESSLKRLLFEIRNLTLTIVEDALEIEYKGQLRNKKSRTLNGKVLPPISGFDFICDREDHVALAEMITDIDDLIRIPVIKSFLPNDFPVARNPFLLGKTVDDLATLEISLPSNGDGKEALGSDVELKVLEFLRFKRAADALIKVERQLQNTLPFSLKDVERLWYRMAEDSSSNILVRCVCTVLVNSGEGTATDGSELRFLTGSNLHIGPSEFLDMLAGYRGDPRKIRMDIRVNLSQLLKNCNLARLKDRTSSFLVEWLRIALGSEVFGDQKAESSKGSYTDGQEQQGDGSVQSGESVGETDVIANNKSTSESLPVVKKKRSSPS